MKRQVFCMVLVLFGIGNANAFADDVMTSKLPQLTPRISRPVGVDLSTSLFGGTTPSTVSLPLLPSAGGLQDKLSLVLTYQTNNANSFVGKGWSFAPGSITRLNKFGVGNSSNPYVLTLNGESQELVSIGSGQYRTKIETFQRISFDGSVWKVSDRKGTEYRFEVTAAGTSYLTRVTEPHGLYMVISYDQPNAQEIYIKQISYPYGPGLSPYNSISFVSDARPDTLSSYATGQLSEIKRRLKEVQMATQGAVQRKYSMAYTTNGPSTASILQSVTQIGKNGNSLPPTTFAYQQPLTGNFYGTPKVLLPANNKYSFDSSEQRDFFRLALGANATVVDLNGDSLPDLLGSQYVPTIVTPLTPTPVDWIANLNKGSNNTFDATNKIWLKKIYSQADISCGGVGSRYIENISLSRNAQLVDMNQDGLPDLVYSKPVVCDTLIPLYDIVVRYNTGTEFSVTEVKLLDRAYTYQKVNYGVGTTYYQRDMLSSTAILQDMNGDGLPDLVFHRMNGRNAAGNTVAFYLDWLVRLNTGDGFATDAKVWASGKNLFYVSRANGANYEVKPITVSFGSSLEDMNGDGLPDLVYNDQAQVLSGTLGDSLNFKVRLNTGSGFSDTATTYLSDVGGYLYSAAGNSVFVSIGFGQNGILVDLNNDGLPDLVYTDYVYLPRAVLANNWLVRYNLGQSFGPAVKFLDSIRHTLTGAYYNVVPGNAYFIDMNKDGVKDFLYLNYDYFNSFITFALTVAPNNDTVSTSLLTKETSPLGGTTTRTYAPSGQYDPVGKLPLPLPFSIPVLKSVTKDPIKGGAAGTFTNTFEGGLYDIKSREFRGFQHVQTTDPLGYKFDTYYLQDPAHLGKVSLQQDAYRKKAFTYLSATTAPYNTPVSQIDETIDTKTKRQNFYYDAYGNITKVVEQGDVSVAGDERTTLTDYAINTSKWMLDFPSRMRIYPNSDGSGAPLSETQIFYDSHAAITDAPTLGDKTTVRKFLTAGGDYADNKAVYDVYGNQTSAIEPLGNETKFEYDAAFHAFLVKETNAKGHIKLSSFCQPTDPKGLFGQLKSETDPNNNTTSYEYDEFGRKTKVIGPLDAASLYGSESYTYSVSQSANNYVLKRTTEQYGTANVLMQVDFQDGFGRDIAAYKEARDANKTRVVSKTYNARGELEKVSLPYFNNRAIDTVYSAAPLSTYWTQTQYDAIGRVSRILKSDGGAVSNAYSGYSTVVTDENGHVKTLTNDAYDRLATVKEKNGTEEYTTSYTYDALNNLTRIVDHKGNVTKRDYNAAGWLVSSSDPDLGNRLYEYDKNGNLTKYYNPQYSSSLLVMTYDALNRPVFKQYINAGEQFYYAYDNPAFTNGIGRRTEMVDARGVTSWNYDKEGRSIITTRSIDDTLSYTIQKTFDAIDRVTSITYPNGKIVKYNYNSAGLPESIDGYISSIDYNAAEQPVTMTLSNNLTRSYTYYPENFRLKSAAVPGLQGLSYEYDPVGNITKISDSIHAFTRTYTYDHLNRLLAGDGNTYTYDAIGNILSANGLTYSYSAGLAHGVSSDGVNTYYYDANGNMTSGGALGIVYDGADRPVYISTNTGTLSPITTLLYYDADGKRSIKSAGQAGRYRTTTYVDDLYEWDAYPYLTYRLYINLNGQRIAMEENGQTTFYLNDHLGGTNVVTDPVGMQVEYTDYRPFGDIKTDTGTFKSRKKFTGKEFDDSTGLYDYGARMYDPKLGRFITADTAEPNLQDPQTLNRYSYCLNNPLKYTDPTGHSVKDAAVGFVDAAVGFVKSLINPQAAAQPVGQLIADFIMHPRETAGAVKEGMVATFSQEKSRDEFLGGTAFGLALGRVGALAGGRPLPIIDDAINVNSESASKFVLSGLNKFDAKNFVSEMGLPSAQALSVKGAISRATKSSYIKVNMYGSDVTVQIFRKGSDGYQVLESKVAMSGGKSVVQKGYNERGKLTHYDPK